MSGHSITLTVKDLRALASFLDDISFATTETDIVLNPNTTLVVSINGSHPVEIVWDDESSEYVVAEVVGS
jgi:hypothetical protein